MGKRTIAIPLAALALSLAMIGSAAAQASTGVTSVDVSPAGNFLNVSGTATFVDAAGAVVDDPAGDALPPGVGADVGAGTISRAPGSSSLVFTLNIPDMPPVGSYGIYYGWGLSVNDNDTGLFLSASTIGACGISGCLSLNRQTGDTESQTVAALSGTIGDGIVRWNLPLNSIGAVGGDRIGQGSGGLSGTITGADGIGFCCIVSDQFSMEEYRVPAATVQVGIAPAGTPEASVPLTSDAAVNVAAGTFSGTVITPVEPGEYVVVAKACYVFNVCGTDSTTITIE